MTITAGVQRHSKAGAARQRRSEHAAANNYKGGHVVKRKGLHEAAGGILAPCAAPAIVAKRVRSALTADQALLRGRRRAFDLFHGASLCMRVLATMAALFAVLATSVAPASASEGCENEARRVEQGSTFLPDCRAYELVSLPSMPPPSYRLYVEGTPPLSPDGFSQFEGPFVLPVVQSTVSAAGDGNAVLYQGSEPNSQGTGNRNNLSRRGADGWAGENIEPPQSRRGFLCGVTGYIGASENLDEVTWIDGKTEDEGGAHESIEVCGHDEPRLAAGEPEESGNLFLRDTATGSFQLVNVTPPGTKSYQPWFDAISAEGSHVIFNSRTQLTADAPPDPGVVGCQTENPRVDPDEFGNVYLWSAGTVHLLTVLPNGTAVRGTLAGAHPFVCDAIPVESAEATHALSNDGERALFYAGGGFEIHGELGDYKPRPEAPYIDGGLYLREHPGAEQSALNGSGACTEPQKGCTLQIDVPEGGPGSSGGGQFQWANVETTRIFFTDEEKLTSDSTAQAGAPDLYEYDLEKPQGQRLTDVTANASESADVLGVSGVSEDGSYVYFVAQGDLTGAQQNSQGGTAFAPVQGSGTLGGVAKGSGDISSGSNQVTGLSVTSGEFHVGQEIEGQGILYATTITACTPNCAAPTALTISKKMQNEGTVELTGRGSNQITGVSATAGAFHAGMAISGSGISGGTWITEVSAGTLTLSRGVTADGTQALSATAANLYLRHAGTTTFVAALTTEMDRCNWTAYCLTARVSPDGAYLAFDSFTRLTGYDNDPVQPNACSDLTIAAYTPCPQTFRYAAADGSHGELTCASCKPSGARPESEFAWSVIAQPSRELGASYIVQLSNNVTDSGEVFFQTAERLSPADENGTTDVYEYAGGEGSGAQLHLISSGQSAQPSYFMNATPDGSNVLFVTDQSLLHADTGANYVMYDARVDGGFRSQSEPVQPPLCDSAEGCLPPLSEPPAEFLAASVTLESTGNLAPGQAETKAPTQPPSKKSCPKKKVLRQGRCVTQHGKRSNRRQKRRSEPAHKRTARRRRAGK